MLDFCKGTKQGKEYEDKAGQGIRGQSRARNMGIKQGAEYEDKAGQGIRGQSRVRNMGIKQDREYKRMKLKRIKIWRLAAGAVIFLIMYILGTGVSIWRYGNTDEKQKADAVIVLGAAAYGETVSPVFKERLNHGIWLYENGYAGKLIVTGGMGEGNAHSDAYAGKKYAVEQGVPEEDVLIEEESTVTQENLENAKEVMDGFSYSSAIIVSDPLHMKRAMLMAKDCGIEAYSSPTPTTRYMTLKSKLPFLAREDFFYIGYQIYRIFR